MKNLEQFIKDNGVVLTEGTVGWKQGLRGKIVEGDFSLRITGESEEGIVGYIHPTGRSGNTINVLIKDNNLIITNYI